MTVYNSGVPPQMGILRMARDTKSVKSKVATLVGKCRHVFVFSFSQDTRYRYEKVNIFYTQLYFAKIAGTKRFK